MFVLGDEFLLVGGGEVGFDFAKGASAFEEVSITIVLVGGRPVPYLLLLV